MQVIKYGRIKIHQISNGTEPLERILKCVTRPKRRHAAENCYTDSPSIPGHKLRPVVRQVFKLTTMQLDADVANSTRTSLELLNLFLDVGAANL